MGYVRAAVPEDLPQIARLYSAVFQTGDPSPGLRRALNEIFFGHPWLDARLPSLVYQTESRTIVGCLGVMPRPMSMNGRPIVATVSHTFMVDPESRTTLAGMKLIRTFLSGRQDVSLAQGTNLSRRIFEAVGGSTSLVQSLGWTRVLRPTRWVLSFLKRHGLPRACSTALAPVCHATDGIAGRMFPDAFRPSAEGLSGEPLDPAALATCVAQLSRDRSLRPTYDAASLAWILGLFACQNGHGPLTGVLVHDSSRQIAGSYLYCHRPGGLADVVQITASPKSAAAVLAHLFADAYRHGFLAVSGQLDPQLLPALGTRPCMLDRGDGSWLLAHSKRPEILSAIHRGDAFLTRLEAEWWIGSVLMRSLAIQS